MNTQLSLGHFFAIINNDANLIIYPQSAKCSNPFSQLLYPFTICYIYVQRIFFTTSYLEVIQRFLLNLHLLNTSAMAQCLVLDFDGGCLFMPNCFIP